MRDPIVSRSILGAPDFWKLPRGCSAHAGNPDSSTEPIEFQAEV